MTNTIATKILNKEQNGVEIYFNVYPLTATRETLKSNGFRWNHKKGCWYARYTMTADSIADTCADCTIDEYKRYAAEGEEVREVRQRTAEAQQKQEQPKKQKNHSKQNKSKVNKFGVKVGDYFSMSWGYEQTNNDFFQVVELVGECSVRIREVNPEIVSRSAVSGMSEDRVYNLDTSVILPPSPYTVHIKDNERGDLKRLKSWAADGVSNPCINMASYANAYYCNEQYHKCYESWYA